MISNVDDQLAGSRSHELSTSTGSWHTILVLSFVAHAAAAALLAWHGGNLEDMTFRAAPVQGYVTPYEPVVVIQEPVAQPKPIAEKTADQTAHQPPPSTTAKAPPPKPVETAASPPTRPARAKTTKPGRAKQHRKTAAARRTPKKRRKPATQQLVTSTQRETSDHDQREVASSAGHSVAQAAVVKGAHDGTGKGVDAAPAVHSPRPAPAPHKVDHARLLKQYLRLVARAVRKDFQYPRAAVRAQMEGRSVVALVIDAKGKVVSVKLTASSGHDVLDNAAVAAARSIRQVPKAPSELDWKPKAVRVPFTFKLRS